MSDEKPHVSPHDLAADVHDADSKRHNRARSNLSKKGDAEGAALELEDAILDNEAADVDRKKARLERQRDE